MDRVRKRPEVHDHLPADKRACSSSPSTSLAQPPSSEPHDFEMESSSSGRVGGGDSSYGSCESEEDLPAHPLAVCNSGKFQRILGALDGNDAEPSAQLAALTELCEVLSFCMEDSFGSFPVETALPVLVRLAGSEGYPDTMLLAIRAITYLCDVMPRSADAIVRHGALPVLCGRLLAIEYLDVAEQSLQALEKISRKQPVPCLQAGTIMAVLGFIGFFSTSVQRVALSTVANVCKKLPSDGFSFVLEAVPILCNLLQYDDCKLVETAVSCLIRITDCFNNSSVVIDQLCEHDLISKLVQLLTVDGRATLSQSTLVGLIGLLTKLATASLVAVKTLFELGISSSLKRIMMPSGLLYGTSSSFLEGVHNNQVHEVLMLLNQLIPSATQVNRNDELVLPKEKLIEDHPDFVHRFSADILPVLMEVVKSGANLSICYSCLSLMHNIMYYSSADILQDLLMHKNISSFLAGLLAQRDQHVLFSTLKVVDLLMRKLQCVFASSFIKEGVVYAIEEFLLHHSSQSQYSAQQLDQQANQIAVQVSSKCLCCTFDSPNTSSSERSACQLGKEAVPTLAKHIKSTYFTDESVNSEFGISEFLKKLKNFCATLNEHVNRPSSSNGWAQSEEHLSELLDQVMGEIRLEESMSTFEFVESGIVRSLVHYLSNGQYLSRNSSSDASANHCLTILKRIQSFAGISLSKAGQTGKDVLLSLVEKLQDALTSLENFPVIPTNFKPRNAYSDIPVVHAALHPCLKVRFVREESEWNLSDYTDIVSIDLCSSFDAIEEYLWPKIRTSMSGQPKELKGKDVTHISVFGGDCLDEKVPPELHPSTPNLPLTSDTAEVTYSQENQTSPKDTNVKLRETMTESNNTPSSSTGIIDGTSSSSLSNSVVKPKLIFSMSGKRLDQSITLYQAILQLQLSTDPNLCLSSKFWTEVYKVSFRSAAPSMLDLKLSCSEQQSSLFWRKCGYPWHKIPFIQSLVLADLPCKLDKSNPAYDILFMIKILEGLNRSSSYLLSYERCTSFAKGGIEDLDNPSVIFPSIPQTEFINRKLTDKLQQQLQDPLTLASGCMPSWCDQLMESCPFLFSFEARWKYFRLTTFGSKVNSNQIQALYSPGSGFATTRLSASGSSLRKKFKVNRSNILESAEKMMSSHAHSRSVYEVEYDEEVGTGLGPTMEFFTLVSHEFRKAGLGMWRDDGSFIDSQMTKLAIEPGFVVAPFGLFPRPWVVGSSASNDSQFSDVIKKFSLLGQLIAKAIKDGRMLDIIFSRAFYKLILGQELGIYDVQAFDPELGSTLLEFQAISYKKKFLESANRDSSECVFYRNSTIEDLCLDFTLPGYPDYELTPGAKSKMVNIENLEEYVQLVVDATIKDGISAQMQAFKAGFNEVFPIKALQIFTEDELDRILCGEQDTWTFFELVDHVKFDHGYTSSSPPAINLLETIQEFECDQRRAFLQFVTGAPRLPPGGLAALNPKLTIVRKLSCKVDMDLPSVMTCANYLKLPPYSSKERLKQKLLYAITEGQGSFHLS